MVNQEVYKIFNHQNYAWTEGINNYDSMLAPSINGKSDFRNNFNVSAEEEIIYCRDTSFWNNKDQGTVVTDWGIRVITNNEKPDEMIWFNWEWVLDVTYKDEVFYFWNDKNHRGDNYCPIHSSYFFKDSVSRKACENLAKLFNKVSQAAQSTKHPIEETLERIQTLADTNPNQAWRIGVNEIGKYPEYDYMIQHDLGRIARFKLKNISNALSMWYKALANENINDYYKVWCNYLIADTLFQNGEQYVEAMPYYHAVAKDGKDIIFPVDPPQPIREIAYEEMLIGLQAYFEEDLGKRPYSQRNLIFAVDNIMDLSMVDQKQVVPIPVEILRNIDKLNFPIGHPVSNQLYVAHPYDPNIYVPYEHYEIEFVKDKLREFTEIAQKLGATEIDVRVESSHNHSSNLKGNYTMDGKVDTVYGSGSTNINGNYNNAEEQSWAHMFNRHQTFEPSGKIEMPENTIWLQGEPGWQGLIKQRMDGNLTSHHETMETRTSMVVSGGLAQQLKGELQTIYGDLGLGWSQNEEQSYSEHRNLILSIDVKFSKSGDINTTLPPPVPSSMTTEEMEYKEEYEACLADGEIAASERRLLDRLAGKLGLSPEQVKRIEESAGNPLTHEEKEYLDEYRACLADDPELSSSTRRLLSKMAKSLGLTEEQVNKLENLK